MVAAVANRVKWTAYCKLVLLQVWKESRKNLLSTIVAAISAALAAYLQFRFYVVPFSTNIPKLLTSFEASLIVLFAYFLVFFFRAPWLLHNQALEDHEKKQGEIRLLQSQLETPALKAEIISTAIKTERISNYVSSAFPTGGYFGLRIVIELRISNDGRVPSLATVTPSLTKGEQDFSEDFSISLHEVGHPLNLEAPIVYALPRSGSFALVLPGKREQEVAGSLLKIAVADGVGQVSMVETILNAPAANAWDE